jgi:hypothetical protein
MKGRNTPVLLLFSRLFYADIRIARFRLFI